MGKIYGILVALMLLCIGCQWQLKPNDADTEEQRVSIQRYDRIESLYLTTGDYSALQQMNTVYPTQTRMLLEDVLQLGKVNDRDINSKFLFFFQDSTLQMMLSDVQHEFADMDDVNQELAASFERLKEELPDMEVPVIYTQIGSFDQSIVVGNNSLGISLDKYLGTDYPFYVTHYSEEQRQLMVRSMIVPDCLAFYILSLYPLPYKYQQLQHERDHHMGKIQWVVNQMTERMVFRNEHVTEVANYMKSNPKVSVAQLLGNDK
jgi:hypothetical protein